MNTKLFNRDTYAQTQKEKRAELNRWIVDAIHNEGAVAVYEAYQFVEYEPENTIGVFSTRELAEKAAKGYLAQSVDKGYLGVDPTFVRQIVLDRCLSQEVTHYYVGGGNQIVKEVLV